MPSLSLSSTGGHLVRLDRLTAPRTVIYCYPMTGVPGKALPEGWDLIPGARGCTPQACAFRDHHAELAEMGVELFGLSTQSTTYQREVSQRLQLPFALLSDAEFQLVETLQLPTFKVEGMRLIKRLTLVVRDSKIEHVFYPVFPPDQSAQETIRWLRDHPV